MRNYDKCGFKDTKMTDIIVDSVKKSVSIHCEILPY